MLVQSDLDAIFSSRMTQGYMKTQWLLLLVCLLTPALGEVDEDENLIDIEDLLLSVQSALNAFKQDQDGTRKSIDARLEKFEKSVDARLDKFEESVEEKLAKVERQYLFSREEVNSRLDKLVEKDLVEIMTSVVNRLDTFELKIDKKFGCCERENFSSLLASFREQANASLSKSTTALPTLQPSTPEPTTPQTSRELTTFSLESEPFDCAAIYDSHFPSIKKSGVYTIKPQFGSKPFEVYCDMTTEGGGWTVFQRRGIFSGVNENFDRNWQEYADGFGDLNKEFWMGLSKISLMTRPENGHHELRIDLAGRNGQKWYAEYETFTVGSEVQDFPLNIGAYSGNAGDSLSYHSLNTFTTYDRMQNVSSNCALIYKGGWWYPRNCGRFSLNGYSGTWWRTKTRPYVSLVQTEMKFRPTIWKQMEN